MNNFPRTRKSTHSASAAPVSSLILEELRQQTVYLRNVSRLANFIWAGLLAVGSLGMASAVVWLIITRLAR